MVGSDNTNKFSNLFQIRWKEKLGNPNCPYLYRWSLIFFGFSIRLHHWIKSDDNRYFHDHSCNLVSIVLKGYYYNVTPAREDSEPYNGGEKVMAKDLDRHTTHFRNETYNYVEGLFNSSKNFLHFRNSIWYSKATKRHWLCIPEGGAWTLLLCSRPYHKWGFYVNNHKWRTLRYFNKFGIIQDENYQ